MQIRTMENKDLNQILAIEEKSFASPWSREAMEEEIKNPLGCYLVLEEQDEVYAYGGMWMILDEAHITNIAVRPQNRGEGWGNFLLYAMLEQAKKSKMNAVTLEVRESNDIARRLYEKYGFKECGRRKAYYENREDALIYWNVFREEKK